MGMFGSGKRFDPSQGGISMKDRAAIFMAALNGDTGGAMKLKQGFQAAPLQTQVLQQIQELTRPQTPAYTGMAGPTTDGSEPAAGVIPQQQRAPMRRDLRDPQVQQTLLRAQALGMDPSVALKLFEANAPNIQSNGQFTYDARDPSNAGRFFPKIGEGINATPNGAGGFMASEIPNYAETAAKIAGATKGAEAKAQAPYDFISVPGPDGRPRVVSKSQAVGGAFTGQSPADATYGNSIATAAAEQYKGIQTAGQQAATKISRYKQIDALLGDFEGGRLSPTGLEIASALNSLGIKMDPKQQNAQAAAALGNQLVLDLNGGSLGTGFSNADRTFLEKTIPGLQQSAGGRRQLIQIGIASAQRQQDVANKARQWQQRFGRIDAPDAAGKTFQDYLDAWSNTHPLFGSQ